MNNLHSTLVIEHSWLDCDELASRESSILYCLLGRIVTYACTYACTYGSVMNKSAQYINSIPF